MVLSMDALFGLPRKKSAGQSFRKAIHGHLFFRDQSAVDEYVASASLKHNKSMKVTYVHKYRTSSYLYPVLYLVLQ